jgi:hypothetical protein
MDKFTTLTSIIAPLDRANIDTDAIIPKQFLKSIKRSGFGVNLPTLMTIKCFTAPFCVFRYFLREFGVRLLVNILFLIKQLSATVFHQHQIEQLF